MKKVGRNEPCPCGSGKKFKKCCEQNLLGNRFRAQKIETTSLLSKVNNCVNLFSGVSSSQSPSFPAISNPSVKMEINDGQEKTTELEKSNSQ